MHLLKKGDLMIKTGLVLIILFLFIFLFPFFKNIALSFDFLNAVRDDQEGLVLALMRSGSFAVVIGGLLVFTALLISMFFKNISPVSGMGKYLNILLIPIVLGNVSSAFIWKLVLTDNVFFFRNEACKFLGLAMMQFWQFGTLFTYLFWLNMQTIRSDVWDYASAIRLTPFEKVKDIILPLQKNMAILLYVISFIFCFYEASKIEFIFKASRGTNTELINHWLARIYASDSLLNADFAFMHISRLSVLVLSFALLLILVTLVVKVSVYNLFIVSRRLYLNVKVSARRLSRPVGWIMIVLTLLPVVLALLKQAGNYHFQFYKLLFPLFLTSIASIAAAFVAILFSLLSRIVWQRVLSDFNWRSMLFLILLFTLLIVPPVVILVSGFRWMKIIGYNSDNEIIISWLLGHIVLSFPLLAGFATATHFRVRNETIDYLSAHKLSTYEKLNDLFFRPFRADYILTVIIAFSLIWNESVVNNILSDIIPSFVTELNKTITGKAMDYSMGMNYLFISMVIALCSVLLWNTIISKAQTKSQAV